MIQLHISSSSNNEMKRKVKRKEILNQEKGKEKC